MDLAGAESSLHERFELACAAATTAGLPGTFGTAKVRGLRVVMTTAVGLGFLNSITVLDESSTADLSPVLDHLRATGMPPTCVVTGSVAPEVSRLLASLGFVATGLRPLAVLDLSADDVALTTSRLTVTEVVSAAERATFLDVLTAGYAASETVERFVRAEHSMGAIRGFLAWDGSTPVGAAALSIHGEWVVLGGAATLTQHRGAGVQAELLRYRLGVAAAAGARCATATAAANSPSARNLVRAGFRVVERTAWTRFLPSDPRTS
ncbi:GNAT family N-acetyltransferase [Friedmanniella luteola]|nr:GNAT family N-acetyltransferase [Friedmanniella luteola]